MIDNFSVYTDCLTERPFDFSRHSTIGCGGTAPIAFYPRSVAEMQRLLTRLTEENTPFCVFGNLSNVLPPDEGMDRAVVCTKKMVGVQFGEENFVEAGITAAGLLRTCRLAKKTGVEFLYGIPCTLGGALFMNAGAGGVYVDRIVESVLVWRKGETLIVPKADCGYAYKKSVFMENGDVILGAYLRLEDGTVKEIDERIEYYAQRRVHLPKGKSMGCVFKNPEGSFAGAWIEKAGLKGKRVGGAVVSELHANFIINDKGATAADIRRLIAQIKNEVQICFHIELREEIRYPNG